MTKRHSKAALSALAFLTSASIMTSAYPFSLPALSAHAEPVLTIASEEEECEAINMMDLGTISMSDPSAGEFTGTLYYNQLDSESANIYQQIYEAYKAGPSQSTFPMDGFSFTLTDMSISLSNNTISMTDTTKTQVKAKIKDIVKPAFLALVYDHPELCWLINAILLIYR